MEQTISIGEFARSARHFFNYTLLAMLAGWLLCSSPASAQAVFVEPGSFRITVPCLGYTSFRNSTGAVALGISEEYVAYGENKATGATHVQLQVADQRKWASLDCGDYVGGRPALRDQSDSDGEDGPPAAACLPFFDNEDNFVEVGFGGRVDITPPAPTVEPFGVAVNALCGAPGTITSRDGFRQLLNNHPEVLADLMVFTANKVYADRGVHADSDAYLDDLVDAWYNLDAFDHIMCGEPKSASSIGGLHFHGRYLQLQESEEACRLPNYARNEVVPGVIYTMGVRMKRADGGWAEFGTKGYGLTLSARDILKAATRAFAENPTSSNSSQGCILNLMDGDVELDTVFVRRANGIRTFFPDATPDFNRNPRCASTITLTQEPLSEHRSECEDNGLPGESLRAGRYRISVTSVSESGFDLNILDCAN